MMRDPELLRIEAEMRILRDRITRDRARLKRLASEIMLRLLLRRADAQLRRRRDAA